MTIALGNFPRLLEPGIRSIFGTTYKDHPSYIGQIFESRKSEKNAETSVQVVGFGLARRKESGAEITMDTSKQGYSNRAVHTTWALGYRITEEARDDNLYKEVVGRFTKLLARSLAKTKEINGHNILNRAFNAGYVFGDGQPLCSANHPTDSAGNQSNVAAIASDISDSAIKALYYQARMMRDDKNIPINMRLTNIIAHTTKELEIKEILKSTKLVNTNYNNINVLQTEGIIKGIICTPYLASQAAWFVQTDCDEGLIHYTRKGYTLDVTTDDRTKDVIVDARERYSFTANDWRCLVGNPGA